MPTNSIFDFEKQKTSRTKLVLQVLGLGIFISIAAVVIWQFTRPEPIPVVDEYSDDNMRDSVISLLAQPRFSGEQFREQILGRAKLERLLVDTKEVFFSLPETGPQEFEEGLDRFVIDRQQIDMGSEEDGYLVLGKYWVEKTPETGFFFKTHLNNLKFRTDVRLEFTYNTATYTLGLRELIDFINNESIYGGRIAADSNNRIEDTIILFANHGAMVAKPHEPSLERFIGELMRDLPDKDNREVRIQRLLDFVTNEIEYDFSEALSSRETLKRPNEVLMSRTSDCSNKTILMASLLEQIDEDYLLLYSPGHITVAVPQGDFVNQNNLKFEWENKDWLIAETTLPNFVIGETRVQQSVSLTTVQYVQKPRQTDVIFDVNTYRPLDFYW